MLTRSFFLGSQKYGAYWTGDNRSVYEELQGSLAMILQLGNAGHPFGGSDVPGFLGNPDEDLFVMFYQLGSWYPFFRAHSRSVGWPDSPYGAINEEPINGDDPFPINPREPWL